MKISPNLPLCLVALLVLCLPLCAQSSFADWLLAQGYYDRALTEYLRISHNADDAGSRDEARLQALSCFLLLEDFDGALDWLSRMQAETEKVTQELPLRRGIVLVSVGQYSEAEQLLDRVVHESNDSGRDLAALQLGLAQVCQLRPQDACHTWDSIPADASTYAHAHELWTLARDTQLPRQKSPELAATLAIMPGAGYAYADHWGTAISALLVVSALGFGTWSAIDAGHEGLAALSGFATVGFYLGNMYGSWNAVQRINEYRVHQYQSTFR